MSLNCVNAVIDLANQYSVPIMLIASRRQIDSEDFGGGYVNNWTTRSFADYVLDRDLGGHVILARDHGGPWQNPAEAGRNLSLRRAMESAKKSYKSDIESGFQILHIDTSIDIHTSPKLEDTLDRLFELYEYCSYEAASMKQKVFFEIGTEEQSGTTSSHAELESIISRVIDFCKKNKFSPPLFVVVQSGTKVVGTRNAGSLDSPVRVPNEVAPEIQIPIVVDICRKNNIFMKEHNTDYLSDETLQWHPRLGIHAANVAPEFGVCETRALIDVLESNNLYQFSDGFLDISYESGKWHKWITPDMKLSRRECAIISGHYVFSDPHFLEMKKEATAELLRKGIVLDDYLKGEVKLNILRYMRNFRLV
jgi:hypothetical protein